MTVMDVPWSIKHRQRSAARRVPRSAARSDWESDALGAALRRVRDLTKAGLIEEPVASRSGKLIHRLMSRESVPPTAMPEGDGGCSLYWVAGQATIEVSVEADGNCFWRITDSDGGVLLVGDGPTPPLAALSAGVEAFTRQVGGLNPRWRENFSL